MKIPLKQAMYTKSSQVLVSIFCAILWLGGSVSAAVNTTKKFQAVGEDHIMRGRILGARKQPRFLSFHTLDDEISVEMQLGVPFLSIPVKKSIDSAAGLLGVELNLVVPFLKIPVKKRIDAAAGLLGNLPTANINLGALGMAGAAVVAAVLIVPNVVRLMSVSHVNGQHRNHERSDGGDEHPLLQQLGRALSEHGAPADECARRAVCALVRRCSAAPAPTSADKIVDGLASNEWLMGLLKGTFLSEAVSSGYGEESCAAKYPRCKLNPAALQGLARAVTKTIFSNE